VYSNHSAELINYKDDFTFYFSRPCVYKYFTLTNIIIGNRHGQVCAS
jgi:hypothetical protein